MAFKQRKGRCLQQATPGGEWRWGADRAGFGSSDPSRPAQGSALPGSLREAGGGGLELEPGGSAKGVIANSGFEAGRLGRAYAGMGSARAARPPTPVRLSSSPQR